MQTGQTSRLQLLRTLLAHTRLILHRFFHHQGHLPGIVTVSMSRTFFSGLQTISGSLSIWLMQGVQQNKLDMQLPIILQVPTLPLPAILVLLLVLQDPMMPELLQTPGFTSTMECIISVIPLAPQKALPGKRHVQLRPTGRHLPSWVSFSLSPLRGGMQSTASGVR